MWLVLVHESEYRHKRKELFKHKDSVYLVIKGHKLSAGALSPDTEKRVSKTVWYQRQKHLTTINILVQIFIKTCNTLPIISEDWILQRGKQRERTGMKKYRSPSKQCWGFLICSNELSLWAVVSENIQKSSRVSPYYKTMAIAVLQTSEVLYRSHSGGFKSGFIFIYIFIFIFISIYIYLSIIYIHLSVCMFI